MATRAKKDRRAANRFDRERIVCLKNRGGTIMTYNRLVNEVLRRSNLGYSEEQE